MKTIEQIALEVANTIAYEPDDAETYIIFKKNQFVCFAKAFLAAVDAERGEPVGYARGDVLRHFNQFGLAHIELSKIEYREHSVPLYLAPAADTACMGISK